MSMEQLYAQFTEEFLPLVADWLTITFSYFVDLFGRFVGYLVFKEVLIVAWTILLMYLWWKAVKKALSYYKLYAWMEEHQWMIAYYILQGVIFWAIAIIIAPQMYHSVRDIGKLLIVPELAVYETVVDYKSNNKLP